MYVYVTGVGGGQDTQTCVDNVGIQDDHEIIAQRMRERE